jgi:Tol biopolymer transport system component
MMGLARSRLGAVVRLPLVVVALVASLALASSPAHATFPGANGKIAFAKTGAVWTTNPDGTGQVQVTFPPDIYHTDLLPAWSPDGTKISFTRELFNGATEEEGSALYVMNADGTGVTPITSTAANQFNSDPTWSPDGTRIAFHHGNDGRTYTANTDGTGVTPLTTIQSWAPAWSPLGDKIALVAQGPAGNSDIYLVNPDGSGLIDISNDARFDSWPSWSPDGSKIVYYGQELNCNPGCGPAVWVMNADGTNQQKIRDGGTEPAWSPDGKKIAFLASGVWAMNADGSGAAQVAPDPTYPYVNPDWQRIPTPDYAHPASAPQLSVSLVPAFKPCGTGGNPSNAKHAPPLATNSCNPPKPSVLAAVGGSSQSSTQMSVTPGDTDPTNGNQANVSISASLTDIQSTAGGDYNPNASGADLTAVTRLRLTDKSNGYGGLPATATEYDFKVPVDCVPTLDPVAGAACVANTSANSLVPGMIQEQRQMVVQAFRVRVDDSGANGVRGDSDDRIFATQGVFVP